MNFEQMLLYVMIFACVFQFYFSFIKGRGSRREFGEVVYSLRKSSFKMKFLGLLFLLVLAYLIYAVKMSAVSALGLLIVFYVLISIFDFSKSKVITNTGIGEKSLFSNYLYNFIPWDDMKGFEWSPKRETMLVFKYNRKGKLQMNDWEVCQNDKNEVERLFKEHVVSDATETNESQDS